MKIKHTIMITIITITILFTNGTIINNIFAATSNAGEAQSELSDSTTDDIKIYTVEDIIFNRVPVLDVNFFSNTAGGQEVTKDSIIYKIRIAIAQWYYSFRNLTIVILTLVLIYVGIRMALSTVSNDKARYKEMIIAWTKSMGIIFVIHFIMIIILNFNETFVNILSNALENGNSENIYETIKTRAYDIRFSVGIPATIMYVILVIFFLRYLWVYIKRFFKITILTIMAPFIIIKYAINSVGKQESQSISSWIYDYGVNVGIQSIHALVYTLLMPIALQLTQQSVIGFIIALVIMNFTLKAANIVMDIFNFSGNGRLAKEAASPMNPAEDIFAINIALKKWSIAPKTSLKFAFGVGKLGYGVGRYVGNKTLNVAEKASGKHIREGISNITKWPINQIDSGIIKITNKSKNKNIKNLNNLMKIKVLARGKNRNSTKARKVLKKFRSTYRKQFKSDWKFIRDTTTGGIEILLAIPAGIAISGEGGKENHYGLYLYTKGLSKIVGQANSAYKFTGTNVLVQLGASPLVLGGIGAIKNKTKESKKYSGKYDKIFNNMNNINYENNELNYTITAINTRDILADEIKKEYNKMDKTGKEKFSNTLHKINKFCNNSYEITKKVEDYISKNDVKEIDEITLRDMLDTIIKQLDINNEYSTEVKNKIVQASLEILSKQKKRTKTKFYDKEEISKIFSDTSTNDTVENKFEKSALKFNQLKDINEKHKEKRETEIFNANQFLDEL